MVPGRGAYGGPSGLSQQTIQAVIRALAFIDTPSAKTTLMEVFTGKFDTDDNATARLEAFKELAVEPTPALEEAMFLAITKPEELWPDFKKKPAAQNPGMGAPGMGMEIGAGGYGAGGYGNDQLMQAIIQAVDTSASEGFRTKLATFLLDPNTPRDKIQKLRTILEKSIPQNIGAQLKLYMSREPDDQTKQKLEQYFLEYSSESLARILHIIEPATPATAPAEKKKSRWATDGAGGYGEGAPGGIGPMESGAPMIGAGGTPGSMAASFESDPTLPFKIAKYLWDPRLAPALGVVLTAAAPAPPANGGGGGGVVAAPGMEGGMGGGGYGTNNRFANVLMIAST